MYFSGSHDEVVYIMASIKLHVGRDTDSDHYICDVLDYNTGTWWKCDYDIITIYSGYTENFYDDLSHEMNKNRVGGLL